MLPHFCLNQIRVTVSRFNVIEINTANKCVAPSSQRQQCDLMGAGNKGDCFVFDLIKNRISHLENEILKKTR